MVMIEAVPSAASHGRVRLAVDEERGIAVVTLADPDRRNALSLEMTQDLAATVSTVTGRADVSALVVTAKPPVFSTSK